MQHTEPLESNVEVSIWLILKAFGAVLFIPAVIVVLMFIAYLMRWI